MSSKMETIMAKNLTTYALFSVRVEDVPHIIELLERHHFVLTVHETLTIPLDGKLEVSFTLTTDGRIFLKRIRDGGRRMQLSTEQGVEEVYQDLVDFFEP